MAKGPTMKFPEPNAERAMQVANYGMDSMREMTEQSLNAVSLISIVVMIGMADNEAVVSWMPFAAFVTTDTRYTRPSC